MEEPSSKTKNKVSTIKESIAVFADFIDMEAPDIAPSAINASEATTTIALSSENASEPEISSFSTFLPSAPAPQWWEASSHSSMESSWLEPQPKVEKVRKRWYKWLSNTFHSTLTYFLPKVYINYHNLQ